jgi:hypothetical protein
MRAFYAVFQVHHRLFQQVKVVAGTRVRAVILNAPFTQTASSTDGGADSHHVGVPGMINVTLWI